MITGLITASTIPAASEPPGVGLPWREARAASPRWRAVSPRVLAEPCPRWALEWAPEPLLLFGGDVNLRHPPELPGVVRVAGNHVDHLFTTGRPGRDAAVLERGPLSDHPPVAVTI